ncbi:HEPN domain-containing protein [Desulfurobacterium sp.]|uniref:HEPN domain-containing protein n=1 Tax=Desulfurobacterium sp. TaxID=2004706 RepID=UPI0026303D9E|nr:HEPN domain-containing protein [Desulfurobacterium sp.]
MNEETKEWIIKANEDYITAKYLISLPEDEIITSAVCFHSQQFVEKIFKAFGIVQNQILEDAQSFLT